VRVWDPVNGAARHILAGHTGWAQALTVAPGRCGSGIRQPPRHRRPSASQARYPNWQLSLRRSQQPEHAAPTSSHRAAEANPDRFLDRPKLTLHSTP
jgi:hypothetical protein